MGKGLSVRIDDDGQRHVTIFDVDGPDTEDYKQYLKKNKSKYQRYNDINKSGLGELP